MYLDWLIKGNPWEIARNEITYPVHYYGHVNTVLDEKGTSFVFSPSFSLLPLLLRLFEPLFCFLFIFD